MLIALNSKAFTVRVSSKLDHISVIKSIEGLSHFEYNNTVIEMDQNLQLHRKKNEKHFSNPNRKKWKLLQLQKNALTIFSERQTDRIPKPSVQFTQSCGPKNDL